jgi:hypothetical protein
MQKNSLEMHGIQEYLRRRSSTLRIVSQRRDSICREEGIEGVNRRSSMDSNLGTVNEDEGISDDDSETDTPDNITSHWQEHLVRSLEALDKGVRFHRSNSTVDNPKLQGDMSMLGVTQVKARMGLKRNSQAIQTVIGSWWDQLEQNKEGRLEKVSGLLIDSIGSLDKGEWAQSRLQ